ncbi:hypothetical protein F4821DRAFT_239863 [Hypoxylon rubiginosum]|uniref:Uncharacterized protein n=1 Tax=Hypoxylon rubiginosum TaxID=110542 RepID=A0ACC0CZE6_9PEZI|nr:hypothetical protein F4821DRAFT_239863 [Hypoxylon rubiginosum]
MDQGTDLTGNVYYKLAAIDGNRACRQDLIHTLAKAAMRDPDISNDIDRIYLRHQQMHIPGSQATSRQHAESTQLPIPQPSAASVTGRISTSAYSQPAARAQSAETVRKRSSTALNAPGEEPHGDLKRHRRSETPEGMIRTYSANGKESRLIDIRSIKDPRVIPQCPRPPKSAAQLQIHQPRAQARRSGNAANSEADEEEPEPKEKAADYSNLLEKVEKDLGWYGKYDKYSDARERTAGMNVAIRIETLLEKLRGHMDKHQSFRNRVHILTVMREMLMAVLQTEGSRCGSEVRKSAYQYDDNLIWAAEKLTTAQRRKLKVLDGGAWMRDLQQLIDEAHSYRIFTRLPTLLSVIDPDASNAAAEEPEDEV